MRDGTYYADRFEALKLAEGLLEVGPLEAGDYELLYKETGNRVRIQVAAGATSDGFVHGAIRRLELPRLKPVGVADIDTTDKEVGIALTNATDLTRVHVIATRFLPAYSVFAQFAHIRGTYPMSFAKQSPESIYLSSRDIGDEYRYILDRRLAPRFPGNMLNRPGLLLNPWAIRGTETSVQAVQAGDNLAALGGRAMNAPAAPPQDPQGAATNSNFSNLDFFAEPSVVLANLTPDKNGVVKFSRELLKGRQYLQILVLDPESTLMHTLTLPEDKIGVLDLRLAKGLDPKSHFTQQKQTTYVDSGAKLNLPDVSGSRFEVYDSLGKVYSLFATLSHNSTLVEFSFITRWPKLMKEEKQTFYSKYACHELNFFIAKKDPRFLTRRLSHIWRTRRTIRSWIAG